MRVNRGWLKRTREDRGYTQESLARILGVTRQHIGLIENGVANPSPDVAKELGRVLEFDWTKLYDADACGELTERINSRTIA